MVTVGARPRQVHAEEMALAANPDKGPVSMAAVLTTGAVDMQPGSSMVTVVGTVTLTVLKWTARISTVHRAGRSSISSIKKPSLPRSCHGEISRLRCWVRDKRAAELGATGTEECQLRYHFSQDPQKEAVQLSVD